MRAVITQNIDRLHERAGSRALVEVHGSIRTASCLACGAVVPFDEVVELLPVPRVPELRARSSSRTSSCSASCCPRRRSPARRSSRARRGLLLVVGSSLEVYPVAGLPLETLAAGGALAIVNRGATPFDSRASVTIDARRGRDAARARRRATRARVATPRRSPRGSGPQRRRREREHRHDARARVRRPRSSRRPCGRPRPAAARSTGIGCASSRCGARPRLAAVARLREAHSEHALVPEPVVVCEDECRGARASPDRPRGRG